MVGIKPVFGGQLSFRLQPKHDADKIALLEGDKVVPAVVSAKPYVPGEIGSSLRDRAHQNEITRIAKAYGAQVKVSVLKPSYLETHKTYGDNGEPSYGSEGDVTQMHPEDSLRYTITTDLGWRGREGGKELVNQGNTRAVDQAIFAYLKGAGVLRDVQPDQLPASKFASPDRSEFKYDPDGK